LNRPRVPQQKPPPTPTAPPPIIPIPKVPPDETNTSIGPSEASPIPLARPERSEKSSSACKAGTHRTIPCTTGRRVIFWVQATAGTRQDAPHCAIMVPLPGTPGCASRALRDLGAVPKSRGIPSGPAVARTPLPPIQLGGFMGRRPRRAACRERWTWLCTVT
jgi:hypothetical protein